MNNVIQQVHSISYYIFSRILVVTMWSMWRHRNQVTFDGVCLSSQAFVERVLVYKQLTRIPRSRCAGQTNFAFIAKSSTEGQHFLVHCYSSPYQNQQMNQCLGLREALRKAKLLGLQFIILTSSKQAEVARKLQHYAQQGLQFFVSTVHRKS